MDFPEPAPTPDPVWLRLTSWCVYRERSVAELSRKMRELEIEDAGDYLQKLLEHNFVNEKRFVEEYIRGKFKLKGWGRNKIRAGLRLAGVDGADIEAGLTLHLDESEYQERLHRWVEKREKDWNWRKLLADRASLHRFLAGKGYEWATIQEVLKEREQGI